ncbi:MAG: hypothetical protein JHC57_00900 [Sphingopyxis sp.]|uniref:hypothetical protein n=1 Tax=Sphingopyxis sp. TaxID=1908224 RepID=UPI001A254BDE|nr:hypothetical protein [Sphingopyxis sp.]MBJ7498290.1 hypothetical protein [Sphingopyxis sp.]
MTMKSLMLACALLAPVVTHGQTKKTQPGTAEPAVQSDPAFELFRLVPGQTEAFIRSVAIWDQVNAAGGQPKTQLYLHEDGEGWDVMLYKPPRPAPTPAQNEAMAAKMKELGLVGGPLYFIQLREKVADHAHLVMKGPMLSEKWVADLDAQRAEIAARK